MKKEMLWFFGALAIVALVSLLVGLVVETIFTAKAVGMFGCLLAGAVMAGVRDQDDETIVQKLMMFASCAILIMIGSAWVDTSSQGVQEVLVLGTIIFGVAMGLCVWSFFRESRHLTVQRALGTCLLYILPAMIITPLVIYI